MSGFCVRSGGDAGADTGPCAQPTLLSDDFNDGVRGPQWSRSYADPGTTLAETGGTVLVTPAVGRPTPAFAGYASLYWYDLTGSRVFVEVPQMVDTTSHARAFLQPKFDGNNFLETVQENGTLFFRKSVDGMLSTPASVPYDPTSHRWWQIRESRGTTYWETSPDGANWTMRASDGTPSFARELEIVIGAGTYQAEASPGSARFDNLNGGAAPSGQWCPSSALSDDFDDGVQASVWLPSYANSGCSMSETGGALVMMPPQQSECAYWSAFGYDLTEGAMTLQIPAMVNTTTAAYVQFEAYADDANRLSIVQAQGRLHFRKRVAGAESDLAFAPWDAVDDLWWRLREAGGMTYWDTSPDGRNWTMRAMAPDPIPVGALAVRLVAGAPLRSTNAGAVRFDNYNLPP